MTKKFISKILTLALGITMLTGCQSTETSDTSVYNDFFKQNEVIDVNIEISEEDLNDMFENAMDEEYHSVNITVGDEKVENVGFRTKGFSSLQSVASSDSDRYSFRVKLDKYVDGQNIDGLDEFVLNNNFQDPSYMREYLSYKVLEDLGVDVPKTAFANVYINDELFGFYLAVEAIDDSFIERISNASDLKLYKADGENATLVDEASLSNFELKIGEDDEMEGLKNLVSAINSIENGNKGDIESIFDVDTFLKAMAVNTVIGNYDSYSGSKAHNYFLLEEDGVFKYIPWDFNMAFGGFMEDNGASVTVSIDEPIYGVDISKRPLIEKLLSVDEYKEKYYGYLNDLVEYYENYEQQIEEVASLIRSYVENDPTAFYTIEQFEENLLETDTDLSTMENKMGHMPDNMQIPEGMEMPDNMQMPEGMELPEGMEMSEDMKDKMQDFSKDNMNKPNMPNGFDNQDKGFEKGEMPEGMPDNMQMPEQLPQGMELPEGMEFSKDMPGMNLSGNVVSITDYIKQRIENIKTQLS